MAPSYQNPFTLSSGTKEKKNSLLPGVNYAPFREQMNATDFGSFTECWILLLALKEIAILASPIPPTPTMNSSCFG